MGTLRNLGLVPDDASSQRDPMIALLGQISDLDEAKIIAITRTLSQSSLFNEVVQEQIGGMDIADRYQDITESFNSIRDDAKSMVDQIQREQLILDAYRDYRGAQKQDDGIVQNNRFGEKRRGYLQPEYAFPTSGAALTHW